MSHHPCYKIHNKTFSHAQTARASPNFETVAGRASYSSHPKKTTCQMPVNNRVVTNAHRTHLPTKPSQASQAKPAIQLLDERKVYKCTRVPGVPGVPSLFYSLYSTVQRFISSTRHATLGRPEIIRALRNWDQTVCSLR